MPPPQVPPRRFGRFDLDMPFQQLRAMPDLKACAELAAPSGHADCQLPRDADKLDRAQIAWEETKNGPETIALRLQFDPQKYVLSELRADASSIHEDIHTLAFAYHWHEADILALPRRRRTRYVEMALEQRRSA